MVYGNSSSQECIRLETSKLDFVQLRGITNRVNEAFEQFARNFYDVGLLLGR
jgi:hypothetical protein